jgi:hypothetical protein
MARVQSLSRPCGQPEMWAQEERTDGIAFLIANFYRYSGLELECIPYGEIFETGSVMRKINVM